MAFINKETVAVIRKEIKTTFPKSWKWSITKEHHSSIVITLLSGNIDDAKHKAHINHHYLDDNNNPFVIVFKKIDEIVNRIGGYYDNSDAMTDYFDTAFYKNYQVGKWDKEYIYNSELPSFEAADQYCPNLQITTGTRPGYVQLWFSDKPAEEIRAELKAAGFHWNSKTSCWFGLDSALPGRYAEAWQEEQDHQARVLEQEAEAAQYKIDSEIKAAEDEKQKTLIESASLKHQADNLNKKIDGKFIPLLVKVHWSESGYFIENTLYTFTEFERLAAQAANERGENSGYYKTKCDIIWSDGYAWNNARIDLAIGDEIGVSDHLKQYVDYYTNDQNASKSGIKDFSAQAIELKEFLKTHHIYLPVNKKSNIVDFESKKQEVKADQFADNLVNECLSNDIDILKTDNLSDFLTSCEKIIFFSGDVEPGEPRTIKQCKPGQLINAAKNQLYSILDLGYIVRLTFDGNYLYDVYKTASDQEINSLSAELETNYNIKSLAQEKFNNTIDKLLH